MFGLRPRFVGFVSFLLFASLFPLAKRKSGWGICGSSFLVWLWFLFLLIQSICRLQGPFVLAICISCLLSCKDRAFSATSATLEEKKEPCDLLETRSSYITQVNQSWVLFKQQASTQLGRTTFWSPKSQCVYGPENEIAAVTFFCEKWRGFTKKQYFCKCNGMAGFRGTRLLIEGL